MFILNTKANISSNSTAIARADLTPTPAARQTGLTMLELLMVVTILSAVAFMSLNQVTDNTAQIRFDDTKNRLDKLKYSIIGDRSRTVNGQPEIYGFVADIGRLPYNIYELLSNEACEDTNISPYDEPTCLSNSKKWVNQRCLDYNYLNKTDCDPGAGYDWKSNATTPALPLRNIGSFSTTGLWSGWNGPYISGLTNSSDGEKDFLDGWGRDDETANYGWFFSLDKDDLDNSDGYGIADDDNDGILRLRSYGMDSIINPTTQTEYDALKIYEKDYPFVTDPVVPEVPFFIGESDYKVEITDSGGSGGIKIKFVNTLSIGTVSLCLRVFYRKDGTFDTNEDSTVDTSDAYTSTGGSGLGFHTITWNGGPEDRTFTLDPDTSLPLGLVSVQIYQYISSCGTTIFPPGTQPKELAIIPGTDPQTIIWNAQ